MDEKTRTEQMSRQMGISPARAAEVRKAMAERKPKTEAEWAEYLKAKTS